MPTLTYRELLRLVVRHTFYTEGVSTDLRARPTPGCQALLDRYGLLFRPLEDGFRVFARIQPEVVPDTLLRPLAEDAPVFRFVLSLANPHLLTVTDLEAAALGEAVFYFNNLRDDVQASTRYLGDSVAAARVGSPLRLVDRPLYRHPFDPPVNSATMTLTDLFGNQKATFSFAFEDPGDTVDAHAVDLSTVDDLPPGRYLMTDNHGGSEALYVDPALFGVPALGVIELFTGTTTLTPDQSEQVPAGYRFLNGDVLTGNGVYAVGFEARATTWQYVVQRKYDDGTFDMNLFAITGPLTFNKTVAADLVTFDSAAEVPFGETQQSLELQHDSSPVRALPNPGMKHLLQEGAVPGSYLSRIYINV